MRSEIPSALHMAGLLLCIVCVVYAATNIRRVHHRLIVAALISIICAEICKDGLVQHLAVNLGLSAPLRSIVQGLCLVGFWFLAESVRAAQWGVLWTSKRLWGGLGAAGVATLANIAVVVSAPGSPERIEVIDGWRPVASLALFSFPAMIMGGFVLVQMVRWHRSASPWLWINAAIVVAFSIDAVSLFMGELVSANGRADGGVLWGSCLAASVVVAISSTIWRQAPDRQSEEVLLKMWRILYGQWGELEPRMVIAERCRGGRDLAWMMIVRECVDFIAAKSTFVPSEEHFPEKLAKRLGRGDLGSMPVSEPYVVRTSAELTEIASHMTGAKPR